MIIYLPIGVIFVEIVHIYIFWIKTNIINIICTHKLNKNSNSSDKLNQNRIICHTLDKPIVSTVLNKDYDEFDANVNKLDYIYQILYKIGILDAINISYVILYQIRTIMTVYAIIGKGCIFYDTILETTVYVSILLFKFHTRITYDKDSLLFYCITTKMDDCNSIIAVINSSTTIVVQADYTKLRYQLLFWCL